jgi:hypothetical protein
MYARAEFEYKNGSYRVIDFTDHSRAFDEDKTKEILKFIYKKRIVIYNEFKSALKKGAFCKRPHKLIDWSMK